MLIPIIAIFAIVFVALLAVQLGTNALVLTGMSQDSARFQAASAFFGVGFTTREAEMVVNHPVRRRIILHLIIAGNVGIASALATLIVTLMQDDKGMNDVLLVLFLIVVGVVVVGLFLNLSWIKHPLDKLMKTSLQKAGVMRALDYEVLLRAREGFNVAEVELWEGHPYAGKMLMESRPSDDGIVVLGILRTDGRFVGAPHKHERLVVGDVLMVYGSDEAVSRLGQQENGRDERRSQGDQVREP